MTAAYILRRLAYGFAVVLGVAAVVFVVTHLFSDPARKMLPLDATQAQVDQFREQLGLDEPLPVQFVGFLGDTVTLDFGESISKRVPAGEVVLDRLPNTLVLMAVALVIAILLAFPLGIIAAMRPGSKIDNLTVAISLAGLSLPQFWLGALLILFFAVNLKVLPTSGSGDLKHVILPAVALALPAAGRIAQMVRSTMIEEMQRQYVLASRARGLRRTYVLVRHVLRNAAVPIVSFMSLETANMLAGGTILVETVFAYQGVGLLAVEASKVDDIVLLQAVVMAIALLVVVTNLLADFLHAWLDPRIQLSQ